MALENTKIFINSIISYSRNIKIFPHRTDRFIYNYQFTPDWLINHLYNRDMDIDDGMWRDGYHCYQYIFDEFDYLSSTNRIDYICDSSDIGEDYDYSYYMGIIDKKIPFIYHQSPHLSNKLSIFTDMVQIELRYDSICIEVFETIHSVMDIFFIKDNDKRLDSVREFLRNTDRN